MGKSHWPSWAESLIAQYGSYGVATSVGYLPDRVYDYVVSRMRREYLDAMLDAEIGR